MKLLRFSFFVFCLAVAAQPEEIDLLLRAARAGNLVEVKHVLNKSTGIYYKGSLPMALEIAAKAGYFEIALFLVERGANPKFIDSYGNSLFHFAVEGGSLELLEHLKTLGLAYDLENKDKQTPYHIAITKDHVSALKLFEKWGVNWGKNTPQGDTVLHLAAQKGSTAAIVHFKNLGLDVDCRGRNGTTALMAAVLANQPKAVRTLMNLGADPKIQNHVKDTAMAYVGFLRDREMYLAICDSGWEGAALHRAARSGNSSEVAALLAKGASINAANTVGETPLFVAISEGRSEVVKLLLEKGADGSSATAYGWTPLFLASVNGDLESVRLLLKKGVKPNEPMPGGDTSLGAALAGDHFVLAQALISAGASSLYDLPEQQEKQFNSLAPNDQLKAEYQAGLEKGTFQKPVTPFWLKIYDNDAVIRIGAKGNLVPPEIKVKVHPPLPPEGLEMRLGSYFILEAIFGKDGFIRDIKVLRSLRNSNYDRELETIKALGQWTYNPGLVEGVPSDKLMTFKIDFH